MILQNFNQLLESLNHNNLDELCEVFKTMTGDAKIVFPNKGAIIPQKDKNGNLVLDKNRNIILKFELEMDFISEKLKHPMSGYKINNILLKSAEVAETTVKRGKKENAQFFTKTHTNLNYIGKYGTYLFECEEEHLNN